MMNATKKTSKTRPWLECRLCGGKVGFAGNTMGESIAIAIRHIVEDHKLCKFEVNPNTGIVKAGE
jgi:hypothetical protein